MKPWQPVFWCRYHIQSFIPQLICFQCHLQKKTNGWQLRLASLKVLSIIAEECLCCSGSGKHFAQLNTAGSLTLISFPWQLMVFWCFPNVSEVPSDVIISKSKFLFSLCFPVLKQKYHTFLLCGCMRVVIRWFCVFLLVFLLFFVAIWTLLGAVMVPSHTSDIL